VFGSRRHARVAVTGRSTDDWLVVADGDFEADVLESGLPVTTLRK